MPVLASLGRPHVHWTADFEDWLATTDAVTLARRMLHRLKSLNAFESSLLKLVPLTNGSPGTSSLASVAGAHHPGHERGQRT